MPRRKPISRMRADMKDLAIDFSKLASELVFNSAKTAGVIVANINPVDTGLSSGNWRLSTGTPSTDERNSFYPNASIIGILAVSNKKAVGAAVFLSNPIEYVRDLNMGNPAPFWIERGAERGIATEVQKTKSRKLK